jgi:hypothetical protein
MAEEWHYSRDGQQLGPVSGDELRRMASAGELQPTDQIWKEGMPKWATASKLKGLAFPAGAKKSTAGPPPLEQPSEKPPTLSETLKAAGSLAANQAKKAQLNTVSLPAAFLRLGKHIFEKRIGQEVFATEFHELDELAGQIKAFDEAGKGSGPAAKGFGENAKALAQNATDAAKKKMATVRFDQALTRLGKGAFEQRGNLDLPQQFIDRIADHNQQIESLDELIQTTTVPNPGWSVFENRFVHSVLGVLFFPVGLFLIWRSELWSKQAKLIWTGAIALLVLVGMLSPKPERSQSRRSNAGSSEFTEAQMETIDSDPNLSIAYSMGHLTHQKFQSYLEIKSAEKETGDGSPMTGTFDYMQLLLLIPAEDWFEAARERGLSQTEFYQTTNVIFASTMSDSYDIMNEEQHAEVLLKVTGKRLDEY